MLLEELAKELVDVTSGLLGGRTVNVMNTKGVIVASTDAARVGTFHQGAMEAVRTGRPVVIARDQLERYPGAKEGCNMPLRVSGAIIGVVGIYGDPTEIQYLARLLEVYAAKYYQLEAMTRPRLAEGELRGRLLHCLLAPTDESIASARSLLEAMQLQLAFPLTAAVVSSQGEAMALRQEHLIGCLAGCGILRPKRDVWGVVDDRLVLLRDGGSAYWARLRQQDPDFLREQFRLSVSDPCNNLWEIHTAYAQAAALDACAAESFNDMGQLSTRCGYMLYRTAAGESAFLEGLYGKLLAVFRGRELETALQTAEAYYDCGRSVSRAAEHLYIHKNTLQYRVRRLLEVLDLGGCAGFQQEYLVRLLLEHHKRKQGLRALE
mgnify:FL=1